MTCYYDTKDGLLLVMEVDVNRVFYKYVEVTDWTLQYETHTNPRSDGTRLYITSGANVMNWYNFWSIENIMV